MSRISLFPGRAEEHGSLVVRLAEARESANVHIAHHCAAPIKGLIRGFAPVPIPRLTWAVAMSSRIGKFATQCHRTWVQKHLGFCCQQFNSRNAASGQAGHLR